MTWWRAGDGWRLDQFDISKRRKPTPMGSIPIVGKCFTTVADFLAYLEGLQFGAWRPKFITMHHTGSPSLSVWQGWQVRANPISDEQWLKNLAGYYGGLGWHAGPHFFITPKHYCVLSDPTARGVHAVSFNAASWGCEVVGDFDREQIKGDYLDHVSDGLAAMFIGADLRPEPYQFKVSGLHFHRDDPLTKKTCPGTSIHKDVMIERIEASMRKIAAEKDDPEDVIRAVPSIASGRIGIVISPDALNIRADASARAPVVGTLAPGARIPIKTKVANGTTEWLAIDAAGDPDGQGWVAARYVRIEDA